MCRPRQTQQRLGGEQHCVFFSRFMLDEATLYSLIIWRYTFKLDDIVKQHLLGIHRNGGSYKVFPMNFSARCRSAPPVSDHLCRKGCAADLTNNSQLNISTRPNPRCVRTTSLYYYPLCLQSRKTMLRMAKFSQGNSFLFLRPAHESSSNTSSYS